MTSFIQPHDAIFANYHSLLSLPVIRSLQEENDQLRRENARLRNVLLTSFEKQVAIADQEVRFRRNTEQSVVWKSDSGAAESVLPFGPTVPSGSAGRLSERLPTVQRIVPNAAAAPTTDAFASVLATAPTDAFASVLATAPTDAFASVLDPALESLQRVYIKTEKMPEPNLMKSTDASVVSVKAKEASPPTPFVVVSDEEDDQELQDSVAETVPVVKEEACGQGGACLRQEVEPASRQGEEEDDGEALQEVVIDGKTYYVEQLAQGADVFDDEGETVGTLGLSQGFVVDVSLPEVSGQDEELEPKEDIEGTTWFVDGLLNAYHALEDDEVGDYAGHWVLQRVVYSLQGNKDEAKPDEAKPVATPEDDDDVEEREIDGKTYFVSNGGAEGCRVYARLSEEEVGDLLGHLREGVLVLA